VITMGIQTSSFASAPGAAFAGGSGASHTAAPADNLTPLARRVHGEYREMPGLRLTVRQAARLFSLAPDTARAVLDELRHLSVLTCSDDGRYGLLHDR
jgi:hypothetical protein